MRHHHLWRSQPAWRDGRGVAAAEFALVAPVILLLLVAVFNIGAAVAESIILAAAVRAGGQYALSYPTTLSAAGTCSATSNASPTAPISAACAMTQALPSNWTNVTTSVSCKCWASGTGYTTYPSCSTISTCGSSATERFVVLEATRPFTSFGSSITPITSNSVSYVVRIQ